MKLKPTRIWKDGPFIFTSGDCKIEFKIMEPCQELQIETLSIKAGETIEHDDGTLELINCEIINE